MLFLGRCYTVLDIHLKTQEMPLQFVVRKINNRTVCLNRILKTNMDSNRIILGMAQTFVFIQHAVTSLMSSIISMQIFLKLNTNNIGSTKRNLIG